MRTAKEFNEAYLRLHVRKEDLFWTTYMGTEKDPGALAAAESALKAYVSDPANAQLARTAVETCKPEERHAVEGWLRFFEANTIEDEEAREIQKRLIDMEQEFYQKRAPLQFDYQDEAGKTYQASKNVVSMNVTTAKDRVTRKTSFESLAKLEKWVLENGYLELVKERNRFARRLGYSDFFTCKLMKNEGMTPEQLNAIFEPFEKATREKCFAEFARLAKEKGPEVLKPYELSFAVTGDVQAEIDPYFPFSHSMARWGLTFYRLGIRYRDAELNLDLIERTGKYENGFMHGPQPCYFDEGKWVPARINFTSNATPNQIGSGYRAINTLFHEGGHAAHFSNVLQDSPSFAQEFPPTSMAYAETQSMFCDSLVGDADWMKRYAKNAAGESIPDDLIRKKVTLGQPLRSFRERSILVVTLFEQRLYKMKDEELTVDAVLKLARRCEKEIFNLDTVARPILIVPHLLSDAGACSYQGYLLANMAVYQTRDHFMATYGYLTDCPEIGKDLASIYWAPGNSITHAESVKRLTNQDLNGAALARVCNASNEDAWSEEKKKMASLESRPQIGTLDQVDLGARVRAVHGSETIADTGPHPKAGSFAKMAHEFQAWVSRQ